MIELKPGEKRHSFDARRTTATRKYTCNHCGNPIPKGHEMVTFRVQRAGKKFPVRCHYPVCFEEMGGQLTSRRTGLRYRACTPIWTRMGLTKERFMKLKKDVKILKRKKGIR